MVSEDGVEWWARAVLASPPSMIGGFSFVPHPSF